MNCEICKQGYYTAVNVNGSVIHRIPTSIDALGRLYGGNVPCVDDIAGDGPEVDLIVFFAHHPEGYSGGIRKCFHVKDGVCGSH